MKKLLFSFLVASVFSGCVATTDVAVQRMTNPPSSIVNAATTNLKGKLKDPFSVVIRNVRAYQSSEDDIMVCGEYNAKNSFGAYSGFYNFYYRYRDGRLMKNHVDTTRNEYLFFAEYSCGLLAKGKIPLPSEQVASAD